MKRKRSTRWFAAGLLLAASHAAFAMPPFTAQTPISVLANPRILPRNINLSVFDPHRKDFVCTHQASRLPPTSPEAEALLQQAMAATSGDLWMWDQDYPAGVTSPSMQVYVVENVTHGNRACSNLNEGYGKVLRYGAYDASVMARMGWMNQVMAPVLGDAIAASGRHRHPGAAGRGPAHGR